MPLVFWRAGIGYLWPLFIADPCVNVVAMFRALLDNLKLIVYQPLADVYPVAQIAAHLQVGQPLQDSARGPGVIKHAAPVRLVRYCDPERCLYLQDLLVERDAFGLAPR